MNSSTINPLVIKDEYLQLKRHTQKAYQKLIPNFPKSTSLGW